MVKAMRFHAVRSPKVLRCMGVASASRDPVAHA